MTAIPLFDEAPVEDLRPTLLKLTESPVWADRLIEGRPYAELDALLATSDDLVLALGESEIDAALAGHPRIGEKKASLDADQAARSSSEQSGMNAADDQIKAAMAQGNADYEERFGRIYLVAAAGRSAEELLSILQSRLENDPEEELDIVRENLAKITRLRLAATFGPVTT